MREWIGRIWPFFRVAPILILLTTGPLCRSRQFSLVSGDKLPTGVRFRFPSYMTSRLFRRISRAKEFEKGQT